MSARRKTCRKPAGEPCVSVGKHGLIEALGAWMNDIERKRLRAVA